MPDRIYNVQTNDPQELNMVLAQLTDHISKIDGTVSEAIEDTKKGGAFTTYDWELAHRGGIK